MTMILQQFSVPQTDLCCSRLALLFTNVPSLDVIIRAILHLAPVCYQDDAGTNGEGKSRGQATVSGSHGKQMLKLCVCWITFKVDCTNEE